MSRGRIGRLGRGVGIGAAILMLALGLSPTGAWLLRVLEDRFPAYVEDGRPVDGIIVLGGAVQTDLSFEHGQLTVGDSGERVIAMADLARRHPSARLVYSGGSGNLTGDEPPETDAVARFAATLALDPGRALYESRSRTTAENARETRDVLGGVPPGRWLVVTSAWHMPRAIGAFRAVGFDPVAYPVDYRTGALLKAEISVAGGLDRLDLAVREWMGLAAYRFAGRGSAVFPAPSPSSSASPIR